MVRLVAGLDDCLIEPVKREFSITMAYAAGSFQAIVLFLKKIVTGMFSDNE